MALCANRTRQPFKADQGWADESLLTKQLFLMVICTASSLVHDQGKQELGKSCRPKVACVGPFKFVSGQTIAFSGVKCAC